MNDYNKKRDFGGRPSFGGDRGGFTKRPLELFQATCAACGKTCEVPFKPNGKKPVYCKECFAKNGGPAADSRGPSDRFAPRRDFSPRPSFNKPDFRNDSMPQSDKGIGELTRQIEGMNNKLDKLVYLLTSKTSDGSAAPKPSDDTTEASAPKEKKRYPAKKFSHKKRK
jgi:CxxC-x17-CxxC domain-containing protein